MTQNRPGAERPKTPIRTALQAFALIVGGVAVAFAAVVDYSVQQLAVIVSFVTGFFLAKALFERLGKVSDARMGTYPRWVNGIASFAAGIAVSFSLDWFFDYAARIGVGVAMVFGVVAAYLARISHQPLVAVTELFGNQMVGKSIHRIDRSQTALAAPACASRRRPSPVFWPRARTCDLNRSPRYAFGREHAHGTKILGDHRGHW